MGEFRTRKPEVVSTLLSEHGDPRDEVFATENADLVNSLRVQGEDGYRFEGPDALRNAVLQGTKIAFAILREQGLLPSDGEEVYAASGAFLDTIAQD